MTSHGSPSSADGPSPNASTLLRPDSGGTATHTDLPPLGQTPHLPDDLVRDARHRLRILAFLCAFVFFMAAVFPIFVVGPEQRARFLSHFSEWGPSTVSITIALAVALLTWSTRVPAAAMLNIGLVFEVVISFGIASAEYANLYAPPMADPDSYRGLGLSWVAVWMLLFTVVVPTKPRKALAAAIASASAVPIVVGTRVYGGAFAFPVTVVEFIVGVIMPYALVVLMAYVGARLVFKLGTDVTRARELGSYRLMERVGSGGMGDVWRAKHRLLARPAAIKLLHPSVLGEPGSTAGQRALARFEREAQATASMRSPHTISLYDFGLTADGVFYYVMELLDGYNLDVLVDRFGPLPPERVVHILGQVCHSLAEAHEAGLIHRDIKPANVFVCRYGREVDFVKVLDFGLVKIEAGSQLDRVNITEEFAGGTPAYIAPEQIRGDKTIDGRADIYATGCLAYWLLTGGYVFAGNSAMQVMADHIHAAPVPPSQRARQAIPGALDAIVLKCLEKAPEDRYQNADELSCALQVCPVDEAWTQERAKAWWREHARVRRESWEVVLEGAGARTSESE